jgi:hypothetical protein
MQPVIPTSPAVQSSQSDNRRIRARAEGAVRGARSPALLQSQSQSQLQSQVQRGSPEELLDCLVPTAEHLYASRDRVLIATVQVHR